MKDTFSLSIANPCSEKWEQFTPHAQGGLCQSCNKHVIDFTTMSEQEIIAFFKHRPARTCGRFRTDQLKLYPRKATSPTHTNNHFFQAGLFSLLMLLASKQGYATSVGQKTATHFIQLEEHLKRHSLKDNSSQPVKLLKGVVKDEYNQPLPGVNVYLKGTAVGTTTDANGNFTFPQQLEEGAILIFNFIGFENKEYRVAKNASSPVEIVMITLCMQLMGEVAIDTPYSAKPAGMSKWWQQIKSLF